MMIADAQVHIRGADTPERPWPKVGHSYAHRDVPYGTADLPHLLALAKRPNVAAKASALPCCSSAPYTYRDIQGYIRQVFDAFGPKRMFRGTDITRLPRTYRKAVAMFAEEPSFLSDDDKEWVMGKGLCEWLRRPA